MTVMQLRHILVARLDEIGHCVAIHFGRGDCSRKRLRGGSIIRKRCVGKGRDHRGIVAARDCDGNVC